MQTHEDMDADRRAFLDRLTERADRCVKEKRSTITAGGEGEAALAQWKRDGVSVVHLPPDEQGVLRVSIGGGDHLPINVAYCNFRGDYDQVVALVRRALSVLEAGPEP